MDTQKKIPTEKSRNLEWYILSTTPTLCLPGGDYTLFLARVQNGDDGYTVVLTGRFLLPVGARYLGRGRALGFVR